MTDHLDAVLDHVAIAVPDWEQAQQRWKDELGGGVVAFGTGSGFSSRQLRYANGAKLELLSPPPNPAPDNFVQRFLDRFGAAVHHVTLKVPDLGQAIETLRHADLEVVDVRMDGDHWREAFLRPSVVGGIVVQVAWSLGNDEDWARRIGHTPQPPRADAIELYGPVLTHPNLDEAAALWTALGAQVVQTDQALLCSWPRSPLTVRIEAGPKATSLGLRASVPTVVPSDQTLGPELRPSIP